jgi:hypothetical protein
MFKDFPLRPDELILCNSTDTWKLERLPLKGCPPIRRLEIEDWGLTPLIGCRKTYSSFSIGESSGGFPYFCKDHKLLSGILSSAIAFFGKYSECYGCELFQNDSKTVISQMLRNYERELSGKCD